MTNTTAEDARIHYFARQVWLDQKARLEEAARRPLTAKIRRRQAAIAYRAARAEHVDPEPEPVRPCLVCRGVRTCDLDSHRSLR